MQCKLGVFTVVCNFLQGFSQSKHVCGIFVDLQKAIDTVNHEILLQKLNYYGIRGTIHNWFRSYLLNRKQIVL